VRIAILGRTQSLLAAAQLLASNGHDVVIVATGRPSPEDRCSVDDFRAAADRWGATFVGRVDLGRLRDAFTNRLPDIGLSVNYPVILPSSITDVPRFGILNAHGGDLPRYRGNACQAWAIINGEDRIGLCIHRMVADEVDAGDILAREFIPVDLTTQIGGVLAWMENTIPGLFLEAVSALESDPQFVLERGVPDDPRSLRCFPRRPDDARISWTADPVSIVRLVNASGDPYSGAFCWLDGERVTIRSAEVVHDPPSFLAVPGQVLQVGCGNVTVAAGSGAVRITDAVTTSGRQLSEVVKGVRERLT